MEYLSSVVFHTVILKMLLQDERTKKCGFVSLLALYIETKPHFLIFVSLLVSKPLVQCGILSMIHTPIYPDLKREKSINVASFLYRGRVGYTNGVFIIDSIPHCKMSL